MCVLKEGAARRRAIGGEDKLAKRRLFVERNSKRQRKKC